MQSQDAFSDLLPSKGTQSNTDGNSLGFVEDAVLPNAQLGDVQRGTVANPKPGSLPGTPMRKDAMKDLESAANAAANLAVKKFSESLQNQLDEIFKRLTALENRTESIQQVLGDLQEISTLREDAARERASTSERSLREVNRNLQILRDRAELAAATAELAKLASGASAEPGSSAPPVSEKKEIQSVASPQQPSSAPPSIVEERPDTEEVAVVAQQASGVSTHEPERAPGGPQTALHLHPPLPPPPPSPPIPSYAPPGPEPILRSYSSDTPSPTHYATAPPHPHRPHPPPHHHLRPGGPPPPSGGGPPGGPGMPQPPPTGLAMPGGPGGGYYPHTAPPGLPGPPAPASYQQLPRPIVPLQGHTPMPGYGGPPGGGAGGPPPPVSYPPPPHVPPPALSSPHSMHGPGFGGGPPGGYDRAMSHHGGVPQSGVSTSGGGPGARTAAVPIEKVIDDVAVMGFSREHVRAVLQELAAQGKSVDLNVVLDRLGAR